MRKTATIALMSMLLAVTLPGCDEVPQETRDKARRTAVSLKDLAADLAGLAVDMIQQALADDPDLNADNYNEADWDIRRLDTARDLPYLSPLEKDVILETNKARANPKKYAALYVVPVLEYYNGKEYTAPGRPTITMNVGTPDVREAIAALKNARSAAPLTPERGLYLAARDHAADQRKSGKTGHDGSDGSTVTSRSNRYGEGNMVGENIAYGLDNAREIVVGLLTSREHRKNMMNENYTQTAAAFGKHPEYRHICVIKYARDYTGKQQIAANPQRNAGRGATGI